MLPKSIKDYIRLIIQKKREHADFNGITPDSIANKPVGEGGVVIAGKTHIPVTGPVFDETELEYAIEAILSCHWTGGSWMEKFEERLSNFLGAKYVITTNSGSSANLLAFTALTATELGDRRIMQGDEIITVAAGFPTTINPIIQNGCIPVFVDIELGTYEIDVTKLQEALSTKTKAIMIAHTLGNSFNIDIVKKFCEDHNLWLIEDTCDALGGEYNGKKLGTFGDIATLSFYPAHHITTGEGGALITNSPLLRKIILSYRDWGRDCWCGTGIDNTCGKRFDWQLGDLPKGFDHKYIYSRIGYNLKITDMQAAIGCAQLEKLEYFIEKRRLNWEYLNNQCLKLGLDRYFYLPRKTDKSNPSWFGFVLLVKDAKEINRDELMKYLTKSKNIGARLLFAGNYLKHPAFINYVNNYRVVGDLKNSDYIMNNCLWVGIYPLLKEEDLNFIAESIYEYCTK